MGLDLKTIEVLLAKDSSRHRDKPNPTVRNDDTWKQMTIHASDGLGNPLHCDNDNCCDPRLFNGGTVYAQFVAEIYTIKICRYCFLDGWLL
jgi:hypothetical protein